MNPQTAALATPPVAPAGHPAAAYADTGRSGIYRTGRRTRVLLGAPDVMPASAYVQVFTWFTEGRDWVRIEIRHDTDAGLFIQTAVEDAEMDPRAALSLATQLASRYELGFVYFQDARPAPAKPDAATTDSWQVCIR